VSETWAVDLGVRDLTRFGIAVRDGFPQRRKAISEVWRKRRTGWPVWRFPYPMQICKSNKITS